MAIAEPALRYHLQTKWRTKGLGALGAAVSIAVGIGSYIYENWEFTSPTGGNILDPGQSNKPGVPWIGNEAQKNASTYQQHQTLRSKKQRRFRKQRNKQQCNCRCC